MMPRLGKAYDIDIQVISKPISEYNTDEYFEQDLPVAPAVLVGNEIVTEGADVSAYDIEVSICRQLDLPFPRKKENSLLGKLFKKK